MAENYVFSVILEPQENGGFTVLVPALPEVVTEGASEKEALANVEEAIRAILAYRRDNSIAIPADAQPEVRRVTWARIDAMTDEEVVAAVLSDPDAQPLTPEQLAKMRRVSA